jgi:hypothetical protein
MVATVDCETESAVMAGLLPFCCDFEGLTQQEQRYRHEGLGLVTFAFSSAGRGCRRRVVLISAGECKGCGWQETVRK